MPWQGTKCCLVLTFPKNLQSQFQLLMFFFIEPLIPVQGFFKKLIGPRVQFYQLHTKTHNFFHLNCMLETISKS
jgi:hypothetical protein